ncbi:leucyl aminopeptidase [Mycena olivaceomarginata]|nr:leucyl aminopeptidase [Mycena olivaceomarginata]
MGSGSLDTYRLPTDTVPTHYDLKIRTDLKDLTFDGAVSITIRFVNDTSTILLNAFELELGPSFVLVDGKTITPTDQSLKTNTQRVALSFAKAFSAGSEAVVRMTFRGKISGLSGYFKSEWVHDGVMEYYTGTFFEPTYARRTFPCWDEPALKATFAVSLISRAGTVNLSNMPSYFEGPYNPEQDPLEPSFGTGKDAAEWIITRFETTPKMSTYILAFANGPFAHVEGSFTSALTGKVRQVRVYATPDLIGQAQFPLELTMKVLPMLETMFDMEYPLPKMDILCANGALGALESWGLIVGDPGAFLFDPATGSTATKERVVYVTSHELAHQWFGNIVTMEWWDNLWLNEGFAKLLGKWHTAAAAVNLSLKYGLNMDARLSSHPVQVACPDANRVEETMDGITYMKGVSLLRMVSSLLGEEAFFKGVALYLKEHQYKNSVAEDLWNALSRTSGTDVGKLMKNWISKTGYPVLTVTEVPGGINVRQNRFLASGIAKAKDDETLWIVPLRLQKINAQRTILFSGREEFIPLDTEQPFKLNASSTGFYRVLYQTEKLNKLALEAAKGIISDMSGLMNDAMAFAKADLAKLSAALTLMDGFAATEWYIVLEGIAANISALLDAWWENPNIVECLQRLDRHIFVPLVSKLGYHYDAGESTDTAAVRTLAIKRAAYARDPSVMAELQAQFSAFTANQEASPLRPDLTPVIYTVAVRHGGRKEYDFIWAILKTTKSPAEEGHAAFAIGAAEDSVLMAETFERLLKQNDSNVDWLLAALSANPKSRRPMVQFFKDNYDTLQARFETCGFFENYSQTPGDGLKITKILWPFLKLTKDTSKFTRSVDQTLEAIQTNIKYLERSTTDISEWFVEWNARHP